MEFIYENVKLLQSQETYNSFLDDLTDVYGIELGETVLSSGIIVPTKYAPQETTSVVYEPKASENGSTFLVEDDIGVLEERALCLAEAKGMDMNIQHYGAVSPLLESQYRNSGNPKDLKYVEDRNAAARAKMVQKAMTLVGDDLYSSSTGTSTPTYKDGKTESGLIIASGKTTEEAVDQMFKKTGEHPNDYNSLPAGAAAALMTGGYDDIVEKREDEARARAALAAAKKLDAYESQQKTAIQQKELNISNNYLLNGAGEVNFFKMGFDYDSYHIGLDLHSGTLTVNVEGAASEREAKEIADSLASLYEKI